MTSRPSTERLLIQVLLRCTQEVLRTRRLEPTEAPLRGQAQEELQLAFAPIWNRTPFLTLTVAGESIEWEEHVVLDEEDDEEGLALALTTAGIRSLTLVPGVEKSEMLQFLGEVDVARSQDEGPDLLTLLFRADLQHLHYAVDQPAEGALPTIAMPTTLPDVDTRLDLVADTVPSAGPAVAPGAAPEHVRTAVRSDATEGDRTRGLVQLEKFDSTLYFLDQKEIEYLRKAINREYTQDLATNALALLLDILQLRAEAGIREEVIGILSDLMPYLLSTGRFEAVAYLISEVRKVSLDAVDLTADDKQALDRLRASVSHPDALAQLFHALDDGGVEPTQASMGVLLRELRPAAIRTVLAWSRLLTNGAAKAAVGRSVDAFFTEWPHALSRMLNTSDRAVVQAALELAARLKRPEFVDIVAEVADHDDASTRTLVARTFASIGTAPAARHLVGMMDDSDSDVRLVVYRTLTARPYGGALHPLERAIGGRELEDRGLREKRALFAAYGTAAGPGGVSRLEPLLQGKGASGQRLSSDTRACAAIALGIIGTPGARSVLTKAVKDRDPVVRSAASSALRSGE